MNKKMTVNKNEAKAQINKKMNEMIKLAEERGQSVRFIMLTDTVHKDNEHKKIEKEEWKSEVEINDCSISLIDYSKSGTRALKRRTISQEDKNEIISNYMILVKTEFEKEIIDIINDENISDFEQFQKLNSFFENAKEKDSEFSSSFNITY